VGAAAASIANLAAGDEMEARCIISGPVTSSISADCNALRILCAFFLAATVVAIVGGGMPGMPGMLAPIAGGVNVGQPQEGLGLLHTAQLGFLGALHPHFGFD